MAQARCIATLAISLMVLALPTWTHGQDADPAAPMPVAAQNPKTILTRMAAHYQGLQGVSLKTNLTFGTDKQGQPDQHPLQIALARPNRISALNPDQPIESGTVCDGAHLYLHVGPPFNCFSKDPAPPSFAAVVDAVAPGIPKEPMFVITNAPVLLMTLFDDALFRQVLTDHGDWTFVGQEALDGVLCDRLRMSDDKIDADFWIAAGDKPWLLRIVPDLSKRMRGGAPAPTMIMALTDWDVPEEVPADWFKYTPPEGLTHVRSVGEAVDRQMRRPPPQPGKR